jgi:predicted NUDIX family phosphoesterase
VPEASAEDALDKLLANALYVERASAETDPRYRQLIPYVVLTWRDLIFSYRRSASGTEERLRQLISVGLGGHIEKHDLADTVIDRKTYDHALAREISEEVALGPRQSEAALGFVLSDATPVDRVHIGLVHHWKLNEPKVEPRGDEVTEPSFVTRDELCSKWRELETWSRLAVRMLLAHAF